MWVKAAWFKFGELIKICQTAKLKSPPNKPHIQYIDHNAMRTGLRIADYSAINITVLVSCSSFILFQTILENVVHYISPSYVTPYIIILALYSCLHECPTYSSKMWPDFESCQLCTRTKYLEYTIIIKKINYISRIHGAAATKFSTVVQSSKIF